MRKFYFWLQLLFGGITVRVVHIPVVVIKIFSYLVRKVRVIVANRRHGSNGMLSPVKYEQQYLMKLESV